MTLLAPVVETNHYADLWEMLSTMRPADSKAERKFIKRYILPLGVEQDWAGNLIKRVGDSPVMWSSHTDTVHRASGKQEIQYLNGIISLAKGSKSSCLGADCTVGVWLMIEMIKAEVPGLYIFHRGEEIGGVGSGFIASKTPHVLDGIECAIAFDRMAYDSVITHQGARCCSDTFADSLASEINLEMRKDTTGSFTDTANYTDIVGECTNISVGYFRQHSKNEHQDLDFLTRLRESLLRFDHSTLVYERKAGEIDPDDHWHSYKWGGGWSNDGYYNDYKRPVDMAGLIADNPEETAQILHDLGYDTSSLTDELWKLGGVIPADSFSLDD